jgi:hypothetical protein
MPYDIEYIRYWPRWMSVRYPPTSGSLLATFWISAWLDQYVNIRRDFDDYLGERTFSSWGHPRLGWIAYTQNVDSTDLTINFSCPAGSGAVARATDLFDFTHSTLPIFFVWNGSIVLRNLEVLETTAVPGSDFSIRLSPLVPDSDVWYKAGTAFERLPCQSHYVSASSGVIYLPYDTPIVVRYSPVYMVEALDASGSIQINGGPWQPLSKYDLYNAWDAIGLTRDLPRLPRENNFDYYNRQKSCYYIKGGPTIPKLSAEVARRIDLISFFSWVPTGAVALSDVGITDAVELIVYGVDKDSIKVENLRKISDNIYKSTKIPKPESLSIVVGGYSTQPVSAIVGNTIIFNSPSNTSITASYGYSSYSITRNSQGYITLLSPVSGNIDANQAYLVYVARAAKAYTLSSNEYKNKLYNPDGSGTSYLYEIANSISNSVKVTLGKVQWEKVVWFTDDSIKPELEYIPRTLGA